MSRRSEKLKVMIPFLIGVVVAHLFAIQFLGTISPYSRSIVLTDLITNTY